MRRLATFEQAISRITAAMLISTANAVEVLLAQARVPGGRALDDDRALQELLTVVGGLPADLRVGGLCFEQLVEQRLQRRRRRLDGVSRLQPPEDLHELVVRIVEAVLLRRDQRLHPHRQPEVGRLGGIDAVEPRVCDPDHLHRVAVHQHFGADDIGPSAEPMRTSSDDSRPRPDARDRRCRRRRVEKTRPAAGPTRSASK